MNAQLEGRSVRPPGCAPELAYYGGTFTALPPEDQLACLRLAGLWRRKGLISSVRCSTRPDALSPTWLRRLKAEGLHRIEVGVQSFNTAALRIAGRGHDGAAALEGCRNVLAAGLELGIQLLPGMPGVSPEIFLQDVRQALQVGPSTLRFYPCLVIEGTGLADLWRQGGYAPWSLEQTVSTLGKALCLAWRADVPVIRLSLAPEPALEPRVLAGPRHPALGGLVRSEALFQITASHAAVLRTKRRGPPLARFSFTCFSPCGGWRPQSVLRLRLPSFCRGFFSGHRGSLLPRWRSLGVNPAAVQWRDGSYAELCCDAGVGSSLLD